MKKILIIIIFFILPLYVKADMGPRTLNKGGTIYGIENTEVEMSYEKVVFSNLRTKKIYDYLEHKEPVIDVSAQFIMYNSGNKAEKMKIFFPFYFNDREEFNFVDEVFNIEVFVEGKKVNYTKDLKKQEVLFDVVFEPKTKTNITIKYSNFLSPEYWSAYYDIGYILHTGALWKNSIGEGEIIFEFPYSIEEQKDFFYSKGKIKSPPNKKVPSNIMCLR